MPMIPENARATIAAYREGKTEKQFLDYMWLRRRAEHPGRIKASGSWPITRAEQITNVTPIKKKAQR